MIRSKRAAANAAAMAVEGAKWQRYPSPFIQARSGKDAEQVLRVSQPLWAGGRIDATIAIAEHKREAAEVVIQEVTDDIVGRVITAFVEALRQQRRLEAAERNVREHQRLRDMIARRVVSEASPSIDLSLAESRLIVAKNDRSQIRQALDAAYRQLSQLTGSEVSGVAEMREVALESEDAQVLLGLSAARSPILKRLTKDIEIAQSEVAVKRAVLWPQVSLQVERRFGGLESDTRAMVVMDIQPGAGLSAGAEIAAAQARIGVAVGEREAAMRDLAQKVEDARTEMVSARERMADSQLAKASASDVAQSYARQFAAGRKSWMDVLNATREATQTDYAAIDAEVEYLGARLRLRLLTGGFENTNDQ